MVKKCKEDPRQTLNAQKLIKSFFEKDNKRPQKQKNPKY